MDQAISKIQTINADFYKIQTINADFYTMKALSKTQIQILGRNKKSINMAFHERDILQCQLQSL